MAERRIRLDAPAAPVHRRTMLRLLALLLLLFVAGCSPFRAVESLGVLRDVAGGAHADARELGPHPQRYTAADGTPRAADLYRPVARQAAAGLVLVPGATPQGRRDPRLVAFARQLAAARFAVLVPELPGLRELRIDPAHAEPVGDAVRHLAGRTDGSAGTVGLAAISYAAGPAVLAALNDGVRPHVGFLLLVGGYYDVESAVTYVTTGAYRPAPGADWRFGTPNPRGKWLFVASNAERLEASRDRALLRRIARRKLRDPDAEVAPLVERLGPDGRAVHALVSNADPDRVPALLQALPAAVRAEIEALDLRRRPLEQLSGPVLLVHGRNDPVVPFTESRRFADALPQGRAELYLVDGLLHANLERIGPADGLRLWQLAYRLLALRDAAPTPTLRGGTPGG